ncbi:ADP-ribosyl-[dinitrogen reductase] glycohydrolase [Vibrio aerogenes CECT 7868]|uniref:ADP-ribosyl-[dinitrogen reductase] glycohydrolase n=1 Tax=Vibrio aerogenes CECT 7868 TaxID=1216006 RepID=A0A1M6FDN1_9VIBR|nr:ADP-ribosylglycohydrolase family protein [Vibrio aerogenes]SHI95763.1 ADP-ribosyl-[dinitrogen reductase] glycohydrolase [Vibrio aerogenes CECT 7868]
MLTEIAVADAYGAGFEFSSRDKIDQHNDFSQYLPHELYGMSAKYTDDTQMSVAIAELIIHEPIWNDVLIADKFVECFKRDPRQGYAKGFYGFLSDISSGREFLEKIRNTSDRNGAAMRSVPLSILADTDDLIHKASMQACVTHHTDIAIQSSCAVALAGHFGIHRKGKLSHLESFLKDFRFSDWNFNWTDEVTVKAYDTVSAAFSCLIRCDNLCDLIIQCVDLGGDTDSVASIAVGLATCFDEYDKSLPQNMLNTLDEASYGIHFLSELDRKLYSHL